MMKCYDCMEEGNDTEAAAVCILCGKGLCVDHSKELILSVSAGVPPHTKRMHNGLTKILCKYCLSNTIVDAFD
ncbi:DUF2180 family protein [Methanococcoides sp. SA1]|nr:DUF2180 family protein [Methanococcoides sp. SA1]